MAAAGARNLHVVATEERFPARGQEVELAGAAAAVPLVVLCRAA